MKNLRIMVWSGLRHRTTRRCHPIWCSYTLSCRYCERQLSLSSWLTETRWIWGHLQDRVGHFQLRLTYPQVHWMKVFITYDDKNSITSDSSTHNIWSCCSSVPSLHVCAASLDRCTVWVSRLDDTACVDDTGDSCQSSTSRLFVQSKYTLLI